MSEEFNRKFFCLGSRIGPSAGLANSRKTCLGRGALVSTLCRWEVPLIRGFSLILILWGSSFAFAVEIPPGPWSLPQVLSAVRTAVDEAGPVRPHGVELRQISASELGVRILYRDRPSEAWFCHFHGDEAHCSESSYWPESRDGLVAWPTEAWTQTLPVTRDVGWDAGATVGWILVAVVTLYAVKKLVRRWTSGRWWAEDLSPPPSLSLAERREQIEIQLEPLVTSGEWDWAAVAQASCGHDHSIRPRNLEPVSSPVASSRLLRSVRVDCGDPFATLLAREEVLQGRWAWLALLGRRARAESQEITAPILAGWRALQDKERRMAMWNQFRWWEAVSREEKGWGPHLLFLSLAGLGVGVGEAAESLLLPPGMHAFCVVGNVGGMGLALSAYAAYRLARQCLTQPWSRWGSSIRTTSGVLRLQIQDLILRWTQREPRSGDERRLELLKLSIALTLVRQWYALRDTQGEIPRSERWRAQAHLGSLHRQWMELAALHFQGETSVDLDPLRRELSQLLAPTACTQLFSSPVAF